MERSRPSRRHIRAVYGPVRVDNKQHETRDRDLRVIEMRHDVDIYLSRPYCIQSSHGAHHREQCVTHKRERELRGVQLGASSTRTTRLPYGLGGSGGLAVASPARAAFGFATNARSAIARGRAPFFPCAHTSTACSFVPDPLVTVYTRASLPPWAMHSWFPRSAERWTVRRSHSWPVPHLPHADLSPATRRAPAGGM